MRNLMSAVAAVALVTAPAAFAATAGHAPAWEPGQPQLAQPQAAKPARGAAERDRDAVGNRETAALNSLEAAGYLTVKDIRPVGRNISVDAQKPGAPFVQLTVLPDGTIQAAANPAS